MIFIRAILRSLPSASAMLQYYDVIHVVALLGHSTDSFVLAFIDRVFIISFEISVLEDSNSRC